MDTNEQKILERASQEASKWVAAFNPNVSPDVDKIQAILDKRTFQGQPVKAYVVHSSEEAANLLREIYKTADKNGKKVISNAHLCIWDYYLMAFYESACHQLENKDFPGAEFIYQSLFPAFEAGLGHLIALGELIIGICLPTTAHRDDQMRIHCEKGPAIVWGKTKQYWWHGTEVPKEWILDPGSVDPTLTLNHPNIEERRALCDILGWDKVIAQLNPTSIDKDMDPEIGELLEVNLPDSGKERFLRVLCGTGRTFVLPVPREMKSAHQANAWTYGLNITDLVPEIRT